jgi:hypothetical protein
MRFKLFFCVLMLSILFLCCNKEINNNDYSYDIYYQDLTIDDFTYKNDTFFYDIDNDAIMDIAATKHIDSLGNNIYRYSGKIFSIKELMLFTYIKIEPKYSMLDSTDLIVNSNKYLWSDTIKYSGNTWRNIFTPNFGFQVKKNSDLYYGWFYFNTMELQAVGFNRKPNSPIKMGQKN